MTESNVMADKAIMTIPPATKPTSAPNRSVVNSDLECRMGVLEQFQSINDQPSQLPDWGDEIRRARAEKRLDVRLREMEIEQKAALLVEAHQKLEEARRTFKSQEVANHEEMPDFPLPIEDMFQAMKAREELLAMEREQKDRLLQETLEMQKGHVGEEWPVARHCPEEARFDHIPKPNPLYRKFIEEAFPGHHPVRSEESNE